MVFRSRNLGLVELCYDSVCLDLSRRGRSIFLLM